MKSEFITPHFSLSIVTQTVYTGWHCMNQRSPLEINAGSQLPAAGVVTQKSNKLAASKIIWPVAWLIVFAALFAWRVQNLDAFGLSNDEGAHLMWARLATDGYPLYRETYAVQAPLFLEPVGWAFRLAGSTIQAGRWVTLLGFVFLAVAISWPAHKTGGWSGAFTALLLTGVSPLIFSCSRLVMAEVPATALAVTSVAFAVVYAQRGRKLWLFVSGLMLGLSFISKALNPFVVAPVGVLLLIYHGQGHTDSWFVRLCSRWRPLLLDALIWGFALCLPLIAVLVIYGPANIYDQLIAFRGDLRAARPGSWTETWEHFKLFFTTHWGFGLLAFGSIISTVLRKKFKELGEFDEFNESKNSTNSKNSLNSINSLNFIWIVWLAAGIIMLALHTPLFQHHFIVLLPPLILLSAGLVTNIIALWPKRRRGQRVAYGIVAVLLLFVLGAAFNIPAMVEANQHTAAIVTGGREQQALELLEAVSNPDDFLMGDSQLLIFMANRRTPPPLGDVALVAIQAGRQTSARMIELTESYRSPAVVQWSLRLPWLPEYLEWVESHYLTKRVWDNDHIIYFGRRIPAGESVPNEQSSRLGHSLALRGFDLDENSPVPGQDLTLKVYWQTEAPLEKDYTIFTQLLDSSDALVTGQDSQPLGGYFPTSQWPAKEIVTDVVCLSLPADLPPGDYTIITGMYLLETLERLPAANDAGDYLNLTTITIR